PASVIDPRSPPLPFTASTRTDLPLNGSGSSILELVFPPPKLVMRKSAPSRFERYRKRASGLPANVSPSATVHRSFRCVVSLVSRITISGINASAILLKTFRLLVPFVGFQRFKNFGGEGSIHNSANFL